MDILTEAFSCNNDQKFDLSFDAKCQKQRDKRKCSIILAETDERNMTARIRFIKSLHNS